MSTLHISGNKKFKGPWFIGFKELEELDEVFEFIVQKIDNSAYNEFEDFAKDEIQKGLYKNLDDRINHEVEYYKNQKTKNVVLSSPDNKELIDDSIKNILKDSKLIDFSPISLSFKVEHKYSNKFLFSINKSTESLSYSIECYNHSCKEEIKYEIEKWINKYKPNLFMKLWNQLSIVLFILSLFTIFVSYNNIVDIEYPNFKLNYKNEINELLKHGVNKENETKSIELILKYITDYQPEKVVGIETYNKTAIVIMCISIFVFLISTFSPKTTLGIGRFQRHLVWYNLYSKFVLVTLPSVIIIPILVDWIIKVLHN